jgi:hypothetical protein
MHYFQGLGDGIKFDFWRYAPDPLAALKAS